MTTRYYLEDDVDVSGSGGGSGDKISPEFVAANVTDATTVAHLFASVFQRKVRLRTVGSTASAAIAGKLPTVALTVVPSGIGF